jgi:ribosomal protein L11
MTDTNEKIADFLNIDYIPPANDVKEDFPIITLKDTNDSENNAIVPSNVSIDSDTEFARDALRQLVQGGSGEIPKIFKIAKDENSPRAYEVGTNLLKTVAEIAEKLVGLHKTRKEIDKIAASVVGNSAMTPHVSVDKAVIFSGTTADFLDKYGNAEDDSELLDNSSRDSSIIDVTPEVIVKSDDKLLNRKEKPLDK